jgi:RNA polymerase subunit RPABC4/transcription elongation factor Spt4
MDRGKRKCPFCGAGLRDSSKFCPDCGRKLEEKPAAPAPSPTPARGAEHGSGDMTELLFGSGICPKCGAALEDGALFCPDCGAPAGERAGVPTPGISGSEGWPAAGPGSGPRMPEKPGKKKNGREMGSGALAAVIAGSVLLVLAGLYCLCDLEVVDPGFEVPVHIFAPAASAADTEEEEETADRTESTPEAKAARTESSAQATPMPAPAVPAPAVPGTEEPAAPAYALTLYTGGTSSYSRVSGITAAASTSIREEDVFYKPANVLDGDLSTSWQEDADEDGIGEYIYLIFDEDVDVSLISLRLGYASSQQSFVNNGRPSALAFGFSNGVELSYMFSDANQETVLALSSPITTNYIKISIQGVYSGELWDDTAISEIAVYA